VTYGLNTLRSKVVLTLLGIFVLYTAVVWFVLQFWQAPAFEKVENIRASEQLSRVQNYIDSERRTLNLMVTDWAHWDEAMEYALGESESFHDDNLSDSNLHSLGLDFGIVLDRNGEQIWGESYGKDGSGKSTDGFFLRQIQQGHELVSPDDELDLVSGLIETSQGMAIVSSAAILWNSGEGPLGGHFIIGKLLTADKLDSMGYSLLSPIDLLPVSLNELPSDLHEAHEKIFFGTNPNVIVKQSNRVLALRMLRDVAGNRLGILQVELDTDISKLGSETIFRTIKVLVFAALILTLVTWLVLSVMLLFPIERLTFILREAEGANPSNGSGDNLISTVQRLTESRGSISKRNDEIGELISAFDDLSLSLSKASNSVWHAAHIDVLTGLPNRHYFMDRLVKEFKYALENNESIAVLFIDLDDFKIINDTLGHAAGDRILVDAAKRIRDVVGLSQSVAGPESQKGNGNLAGRIGGDEYVVMLTTCDFPSEPNRIAADIVSAISEPFNLDGEQGQIGACVGLAVFPEDAQSVSEILSNADSAMDEAKRAGKNSWRRFVDGLSRNGEQKIA